jgi:uncharacterized protein HemX
MASAFALVTAAIVGALLNSLGAYLNDHFAQRREARQAEREAEARRQEWEREDRIRQEQSEQQEKEKRQEQLAKVYKRTSSELRPFRSHQASPYPSIFGR